LRTLTLSLPGDNAMSDQITRNYLNTRYRQVENIQKELYANMNHASGDDILAYKKLSVQKNYLQNVLKSEFQFDHNTKKKIIDSFQ
jgi:hypothetical protein